MFSDLDATLQAMLTGPTAPAELRAVAVAFETPDKDYRPALTTLNFFLHDVGENRALRDPADLLARTPDGYRSSPPVLRVDCTYLVTVWSAETLALRIEEEHRLLALALTWLARFAVIDASLLRGALKVPPQPYPVTTSVAQTREGQSMGQFWSALGIPPRPAFSLAVTVTLQPFDDGPTYPAVDSVHVQSGSVTQPALAGRVLDHALVPVAAATVVELATGRQVTTGPGGEFAFAGLDFGSHTLRVRVTGQADVDADLSYDPQRQIHNLILPGS